MLMRRFALRFMCCRFGKVLEAGADSIAVISAITKADDVSEAVKRWSALFRTESCTAGDGP